VIYKLKVNPLFRLLTSG